MCAQPLENMVEKFNHTYVLLCLRIGYSLWTAYSNALRHATWKIQDETVRFDRMVDKQFSFIALYSMNIICIFFFFFILTRMTALTHSPKHIILQLIMCLSLLINWIITRAPHLRWINEIQYTWKSLCST